MKQLKNLVPIAVIIALAGCNKKSLTSPPPEGAETFSGASKTTTLGGAYLKEAAKDHSSPPYIRLSAEVFSKVQDGVESDKNAFRQAINELAATRNAKTCQIWIAMMHASEAGLPEVLPSLEELGKMEKQARGGTLKGVESNPLRFIDVLTPCVKYLTEFDMPEADRAVAEFVHRFEIKYGKTDAGKHCLSAYQREISDAREIRSTGVSRWKLGREYLKKPKEY
jgi:hypothetical protein